MPFRVPRRPQDTSKGGAKLIDPPLVPQDRPRCAQELQNDPQDHRKRTKTGSNRTQGKTRHDENKTKTTPKQDKARTRTKTGQDNFNKLNLRNASFRNLNLKNVNLKHINLNNLNFKHFKFTNLNLKRFRWKSLSLKDFSLKTYSTTRDETKARERQDKGRKRQRQD